MNDQLALLSAYLTAHLQLSLAGLLVGILVSVPLGVLVTRVRWLERPVLAFTSVIQTIPSLALLAIMVPLLAAVNLKSIGYLPAFICLVLYSVLPILRNTVTGLAAIDPALIEAARGVGMKPHQQLFRVELPLAMPIIIAGIRTSTIWTVGIATLSTPVGATSLGNYIFAGLQTRNVNAILIGCIAAAVLALTLDGLVRLVAVGWQQRRRGLLAGALSVIVLLFLYVGFTLGIEYWRTPKQRVVIGAKTFTEQYILSELLAEHIMLETGTPAIVAQSLGSTVVFDALCSGEIDVYVDYSGTIWATVMHRQGSLGSRADMLVVIKRFLHDRCGIAVVGALGFENAYALAMRRAQAKQLHVQSIGDLVAYAPKLSIGGDYEFFGRAEWRSLQQKYGLVFATIRSMDSSLMYQAAAQGSVDVISAYSTDGRIAAHNLVVLKDDRGAIPPYDAIILVSAKLVRRSPATVTALKKMIGKIDDSEMRRMNLTVDEHGKSPRDVARDFLKKSHVN